MALDRSGAVVVGERDAWHRAPLAPVGGVAVHQLPDIALLLREDPVDAEEAALGEQHPPWSGDLQGPAHKEDHGDRQREPKHALAGQIGDQSRGGIRWNGIDTYLRGANMNPTPRTAR